MTSLLGILGGVFVGVAVMLVRGMLGNEVQGRVERRIKASVEATITALPQQLQDEWGDEWRTDLAELIKMPLSAAMFARNLRASAAQLVGEPAIAPAEAGRNAAQLGRSPSKRTVQQQWRRWSGERSLRVGGARAWTRWTRSLERFNAELARIVQ